MDAGVVVSEKVRKKNPALQHAAVTHVLKMLDIILLNKRNEFCLKINPLINNDYNLCTALKQFDYF